MAAANPSSTIALSAAAPAAAVDGDDATAPAVAAAAVDDDATPTLAALVAPIRDMPEDERPFGAHKLLQCSDLLKDVEHMLINRPAPDVETIEDQDRVLLKWLAAYHAGLSATPAIVHGDMMEAELIASGLLAPFIAPGDDGAAQFGVPTRLDTPADNASELLRLACSALVCLYVYLNFRQAPGGLPPDEALLVFSTMTAGSVASSAERAAALDAELAGLGAAPEGFGAAQVRWLAHYVRGLVLHHMSGVLHLAGQRERQAEVLAAHARDAMSLVKADPAHALGYTLYARASMSFQQMSAAAAFLRRGLEVARAARDDGSEAAMCFQLAAALALGGNGGGDNGRNGGAEFDGAEVVALREAGEAARASQLRWFPALWAGQAGGGEPDRSLLATRLLPEWVRRTRAAGEEAQGQEAETAKEEEEGAAGGSSSKPAGSCAARPSPSSPAPVVSEEEIGEALRGGGAHCRALTGLLYVAKPPAGIPPGALVVGGGDGGGEGGGE